MYEFEKELLNKGHNYIAGCDEVGRGPLAGPVVAAAVILDPFNKIEGLEECTNLQVLNLFNNKIQKIEGLDTLTSLQQLSLGKNQIGKIGKKINYTFDGIKITP